ncbi:MAG: pheromone autoinducer 2 transporter [Sulfurovum sp.]|nr:MAG: pheromone autoinducer 2 transporter [Sulfurovum sp.]PHS41399.1 MAG: pheromone autoinducer 2 transporter [Sulfurovum sp.]
MKENRQKIWPVNQLLMFWAFLSIIMLVLKYASELVVPLLIAIAIAIVLSPLLNYLERKHIPKVLSLMVLIFISLIPTIILGGYIGEEVRDFANNFQQTKGQFSASLVKFSHFMQGIGIQITQTELQEMLSKSNVSDIIKNLFSQAGSQFSNIFLIFFMVAFMLMESQLFYNKMMKITQTYDSNMEDMLKIIEKIKTYFLIKVKTSLLTGVSVFVVLWFYDVNYAYLWATLAFFLNFIPVIGSIIAAVPPVIMAFIDQGVMTAMWVATGYVLINMIVGNILEPKIMGKGLGLSALVIFLSMTFWGWIFGPAGMILSVPLTMIVQFIFSQYKETEWLSILLSDYEKEPLKVTSVKEENIKEKENSDG